MARLTQQWARISSLLVRKTPKQCKARWYEWLDPSIKKIEWSKEEDEKLLHLAKLMPTQWRTIAPIVGRTATQCLDRYQHLLDEADTLDTDELALEGPGAEAAPSADDVRRLRPGEIDPDPETKPAKPDAIDMDDEEKEMLSEARARLANTEGKKAKRKARERALEDSRRLAMLQKRRELKVAGIFSRTHKKTKDGVDYNAEIPFEKQPAPGFYDTTEEQARVLDAPLGRTIRAMETNGRPDATPDKRKRDEKRPAQPKHDEALRKLREEEVVLKRRKLLLPDAHVGERELEQIVKMGHAGSAARALVEGDEGAATEGLLGEYATMEAPETPAATPTPARETLLREAQNLKRRTETQTPLLGDDNTQLHETHAPVAATPTPRPGATPTPLRTTLGLYGEPSTPRSTESLASALHTLPAPKNDFELVVDGADDIEAPVPPVLEEDAAERDARLQAEADAERKRAFARRSHAVQRDLPRPLAVDAAVAHALRAYHDDPVQRAIDDEMLALIEYDAHLYPQPGSRVAGGALASLPAYSDEALAHANDLVQAELATALGFPGARPATLQAMLAERAAGFEAPLAHVRAETVYSAEHKTYVLRSTLTDAAVREGQAALLATLRTQLGDQAALAAKGERTLGKLLGGYQARSKTLAGKIAAAASAYVDASQNLAAFERLALGEDAAAADRQAQLQKAVADLQRTEAMAQAEYRTLDAARTEASERYDALQTELDMRRAERALGVQ